MRYLVSLFLSLVFLLTPLHADASRMFTPPAELEAEVQRNEAALQANPKSAENSNAREPKSNTSKKVSRSALFRIDLEDHGEPGGTQPGGGTAPPDRYRIRIWVLTDAESALLQNPNDRLLGFRRAIAASPASTPVQDGAVDGNGHPVSSASGTAVFGVRPPDVDDGGALDNGNVQIHPEIKQCP